MTANLNRTENIEAMSIFVILLLLDLWLMVKNLC